MLRRLFLTLTISSCLAAMGQIEELPVRVINGTAYYYYEVPSKATIYSITRKYGVSREELFKYNPQVIDGLRAGDTLLFPVVKDNVNVDVDVDGDVNVDVNEPADTLRSLGSLEPLETVETVETVETIKPGPVDSVEVVNVGIMLPFMLNSESMTRQAQNHTNFYRGALLAVEKLASADNSVTIRAYDTEGSTETLRSIMAGPEIQNLDYIIAPGDSMAIEVIAATADTTGASIINLFAVKNDGHLRHESVVQGNIPHDAMYTRAVEAFCEHLKGKKALILNATDIPADKRAFIEELTASMMKQGIPYEQIDYAGKLTAEDLQGLPLRDYAFIPTSSSREALMKILPALGEFTDANPAMATELLGYPEWVVIRGEVKDRLHRLGATVYSRFSTDLDGADVAAVNQAYANSYGEEPQQSLPDVMLLGYDTIAWILNGTDRPYTGLQNSFKLVDLTNGGEVNEGLYLLNFTRSGRVDARAL